MRSGPIQPEVVQEQIDRREEELPLWEQSKGANINLPWTELNRSDALNDVKPLIENAHSLVLAIGATATSRKTPRSEFHRQLRTLDMRGHCLFRPRRAWRMAGQVAPSRLNSRQSFPDEAIRCCGLTLGFRGRR